MAAVVATIENLGQIDNVAVIPEWILLTGAIGNCNWYAHFGLQSYKDSWRKELRRV
ncbi:MAG: hypothetical protein CM15mP12_6750 [Gammaproteobacteria bacterium]|nr:MAG: hypothetical protein CM15mP12_6750 [Gammaproteobacteria bacterium]